MSPTTIFVIGLVATAGLAVLGIFAVAFRRGESGGPVTAPELDRRALRADRARRRAAAAEERSAVATLERTEVVEEEEEPRPPPPDPALQRAEITETDFGITRRKFLTRSVLAVFGLFLAQFAIAGLAFFWPRLRGGFGTPVNAGRIVDLKTEIVQGATMIPRFVASAQSWIVPFELSLLEASAFDSTVVAGGEEDGVALMALWQRCVHLGCRVPECIPSQGFECPCHGSKYNLHGEYEQGPAPRNLDRFAVSQNEAGELIIDTGTVVQTPRSTNKTIAYPQGPFCV